MVARLELIDLVRAGADWLEIERRVASRSTHVVFEQMLRQDIPVGAAEDTVPAWGRVLEIDLDRRGVDRIDRVNDLEVTGRRGGRVRIR